MDTIVKRVAIISCLLSGASCLMLPKSTQAQDVARPDLSALFKVQVTAKAEVELYKGLPALVELTVKNVAEKVKLPAGGAANLSPQLQEQIEYQEAGGSYAFPQFDLFSQYPPISIEVLETGGKQIKTPSRPPTLAFWERNPAQFDRAKRRPYTTLYAGTSKSFVIDIMPWVKDLPGGDYILRLHLYPFPESQSWGSNELKIRLNERMTLSPKQDRADYLYDFFHASVSAGNMARAPLNLLDELPLYLQPTADALRYEVLLAQDKKADAAALRVKTVRNHPEIEWRLDAAKNGNGLLRQVFKYYRVTI